MKARTDREEGKSTPEGSEKHPPQPQYHVQYPVAYDIGAPYTVLV